MQESDISWTDYTWNPTHGCSRASAGCENCYAERISRQYQHTEHPWTNQYADQNVSIRPEKLDEPYSIDEPATCFVNSMSDLFHSAIPEEFIQKVIAVMRNCPHIVFQILTKRPGRAAHMAIDWPPNVWLGTSVEDDRVVERLDLLRDCDAETLFVSFEPLIGPVGDIDLAGYQWAIVGGESGPDDVRREMDHAWARDIYRQCQQQDVSFYFKQSSGRYPETGTALTVKNEAYGVFEQREIRELPDPARAVRRARQSSQRMVADGGERE